MRRPSAISPRFSVLLALGLAVSVAPPSHAAERITLASGFSVDCLRHEPIGDHLRLLLSNSNSEENYLEVPTASVTSIATIPDATSSAMPDGTASTAAGSSPKTAPGTHERLSAADMHPLLERAGQLHRVDADLLASVVHAESNGHTQAVSRTGARGLMQLMPGTASELGVTNTFAPEQNIDGGSAYLDHLLTRYHDNIALALAAYNAGPAAVDRFHGIPPYRETRAYVTRVILEFNRRKLALTRQQLALRTTPAIAAAAALPASLR